MNKVNLDKGVKRMEVFYDARCAMCRTFIDWLVRQERACDVVCFDYHCDEARNVFADLDKYDPEKEMVVRVDEGEIYQGAEGWVCCLWSCAKYRDVAEKVNSRLLLPMVKKVCCLASRNRLLVSKMFFGKKSKEIAEELEKNKEMRCEGGCE